MAAIRLAARLVGWAWVALVAAGFLFDTWVRMKGAAPPWAGIDYARSFGQTVSVIIHGALAFPGLWLALWGQKKPG